MGRRSTPGQRRSEARLRTEFIWDGSGHVVMQQPYEVARLLERHYGRCHWEIYRSGWSGLAQFVLERSLSKSKYQYVWQAIQETWIQSASELAPSKREEILEFLEPLGVTAATTALLHKLAIWWHETKPHARSFSDVDLDTLPENEPLLMAIGPAWAIRVLGSVFGARVTAASTGCWRIGARHGWFGWEDDSLQATESCLSIADAGSIEPAQVTEWLNQVASDFCGPKPRCRGCPLESLLGPAGPIEPDHA